MILVSIKLPEEIPWYRASRRGIVAISAGCRKQTLFAICRIYMISAPQNAAIAGRLQEILGPRRYRDHASSSLGLDHKPGTSRFVTNPPGACSLTILALPRRGGLVNIGTAEAKASSGSSPLQVTSLFRSLTTTSSYPLVSITKLKKRAPSVVYRKYLVSAQDPVFRGCVSLGPCLPTDGQ